MTTHETIALLERIQSEAPPELGCLPDCDRYTPRQREVVQLVHSGMTYDEISRELGISTHTVKAHLQAARAVSNGFRYARAGVR